jgi:predicted amidohydrolase YtcJ
MSQFSRREALGLGALLAIPALAPAQTSARGGGDFAPDLIAINGNVLTMDDSQPRAEAFAVKDGRFIAVGSTADVRSLATRRTQVIDCERMTVTPGFIDAHCHPGRQQELYDVNADRRSIKEIQDALRERAAKTPPGYWVVAFKFDDTKVKEQRLLSRKDLDAAVPHHPVIVMHRGGHTGFLNSKAFELAGVTRETPDPPGGRFFRDANGDLQGQVADMALLAFEKVGKYEQFTLEQERQRGEAAMAYQSKQLVACGLTTVHDAGAESDKIRTYQALLAKGELLHRSYILAVGLGREGLDAYQKLRDAGVYTGFGNEHVRIGPVKFVADGSASERTMSIRAGFPGKPHDHGLLTLDQKQLDEAVEDAHRHGWQIGIHANGDVAIDMVLNAYERVLREWPHPDRRHRIEHCTLVNPDLIRRIKATGSIPTPFWTYVYYHGEKWRAYGEENVRWMFAHKSFLEAGIRVPGASDYQPGPFEPMMALQSLVTRKDYAGRVWGANQKVTVDEALRIGTINGAYASYEENVKGSISAGKLADFVILDKDPHAVDPDTLKDIQIVRTVVGGKTVFSRA